ncbi:VOC family protein [Siphonobacter sp. SORGH_AS_0500]|uniref:bleomycin resistance protein n=1 Tax=Siphonobacter sp. SORGH_AS_0500 TaxID=1864824 RepID=UPI0028631409|nr:VOC family protein [Siphonobacter sp. SORGH_AS_0500]MDR6197109.1 catechol 2,3-dioxygenase-like lactoylglutathione lyase family enzyme [Siphonobacter sp. SORGH_AS_0500]
MLLAVHPKLPMRQKHLTKEFYLQTLGFEQVGSDAFPDYLMVRKDQIEIHFFVFTELDPAQNYGQVYIRTEQIEALYASLVDQNVSIHPAGALQRKPWGPKEFSLLDPDSNLLTFGEQM